MKYNNYILLGIAFTALPVSIQAQTQPKDTTVKPHRNSGAAI